MRIPSAVAALTLGLSQTASADLTAMLQSATFLNEGVWTNTSGTTIVIQEGLYLEPENITKAEFAWADISLTPQVYSDRVNAWKPSPIKEEVDLPGNDLSQVTVATQADCDNACHGNVNCRAWVFAPKAPTKFGSCEKGRTCCYLKNGIPTEVTSSFSLSSRVVRMSYGEDDAHPAVGIRSAPPLGGLATGTIELRGDGTLTAWTVENNSPGGSAKFPKQKHAYFAARVQDGPKTWSRVLQTHPEGAVSGSGVSELHFGGSPPMTRLQVKDAAQPNVDISLFGYGRLSSGNMNKSHHPAIAFSMVFTNKGSKSVNVASLFNLPTYNENIDRNGTVLSTFSTDSEVACMSKCTADAACGSWKLVKNTCSLIKEMPYYAFMDGVNSGTPVTVSKKSPLCVGLDKRGNAAMSGGYTVCGTGGKVTMGSGSKKSFGQFSADGFLDNTVGLDDSISLSVNETVAAGETVTLTIILGYYFPNHNYLNQMLGNQYTKLFTSATDSAEQLMSGLTDVVADALAIQNPLLKSTLPEWLSDTLIGQLHHMRSAMWFHDGRWRQWEAYDCVNVDSVHNDGERHIPYIMLFPESTKSKMIGWSKTQLANGMIQEQLACGCMGGIDPHFESGCGRVMSDVSSMYIVYLLELLRWNNDQDFVKEWFPTAKKAADWHISVSTFHNMPYKLQTTYDVLALNQYETCSYSAVFHILAMRSMAELCVFMGETAEAKKYNDAAKAAQESFESIMWNEELGAYMAYYGGNGTIMADTFYAQVLAYTVGLETLVNETRLMKHLETEQKVNFDGVGLQILTGRAGHTDPDIWMMANGDHGALLLRNAKTSSDVDRALSETETPFKRIRTGLNDVWNAAGILRGNYGRFPGSNYFTSHYGYYMTVWHAMLAMTKQVVNLPEGIVSFDPAFATSEEYSLPVFIPGVVGELSNDQKQWKLCLTTGTLADVTVTVNGKSAPKTTLSAPNCVSVAW